MNRIKYYPHVTNKIRKQCLKHSHALNLIKVIGKNYKTDVAVNGERLRATPKDKREKDSLFSFLFKIVLKVLDNVVTGGKAFILKHK